MGNTKLRSEKNSLQVRSGEIHSDFQIQVAGLLVSTKYPFMGAAPDDSVMFLLWDWLVGSKVPL